MDTAKTAAGIIADAERRLRELVGTAASAGEYDAAQRVTQWARTLGAMACEADDNGAASGSVQNAVATIPRARVRRPVHRSRRTNAVPATGKRRPAKGQYPRFFRRGDDLVKIGWSKKQREEYVHKAPRRVIDALAVAIARCAGAGRAFTTEDLLPLKDPTTGEELPGYQAYVALAWFKSAGLVKQHGRSGYTLCSVAGFDESVARSWERLAEYHV